MKKCLLLFLFCFSAVVNAQERALYHEEFDINSTGIFLPVEIDGKECRFLFDTGASLVVLDRRFRYLLGKPLSLHEAEASTGIRFKNREIITPNGELSLEMYKAIPLKLGRLQIANRFPYIVADLHSLWPFSGVEFCGILGTAFLNQFRWEIDFKKGFVKGYIGAEPYGGEYRSQTPIFWSAAGIPQVGVSLSGEKLAFDIDTGDNGSGRLSKRDTDFLKKKDLILKSRKQEVVTVSALSESEEHRLKQLGFAGVAYPGIVMQESRQNALGLAFFKRHNIVLDFPFNMLYLQHHEEYAALQEVDKSGVRIILKEKKLIVFSIDPLEGALVKGLRKGDEIISVNTKRVSLYQMRKLLRAKEGTALFLEIRRKKAILQASIVLGPDPL